MSTILPEKNGKDFFMVKKLCAAVLSVAFIFALTTLNNPPAFLNFSKNRTVYTGTSSVSFFKEYSHFSCVNKMKGESCKIPVKEFDFDKFIEYFSAEKVITETLSGTTSYYFTSEKLKNYVLINGQKINLHIAINNEYAVIGYPIIYGGY